MNQRNIMRKSNTTSSLKLLYISMMIFIIFSLINVCLAEEHIQHEEEIVKEQQDIRLTPEEEQRQAFSAQWEREMSDYEPDFVYMIPLDYKTSEVFYQNITNAPFKLRGALLIDEDKKENIDFRIESPSGKIVYKNTTGQCIFNIDIYEKGIYKFYFDNKYENNEIRVTFTLNSGNNNVLKKTDLSFAEQKANALLDFLKKLRTERKLKNNSNYNRSLSKVLLSITVKHTILI